MIIPNIDAQFAITFTMIYLYFWLTSNIQAKMTIKITTQFEYLINSQ